MSRFGNILSIKFKQSFGSPIRKFCRGIFSWLYARGFWPTLPFVLALESVNLCRNLAPDELRDLRAITQERHFAAGCQIFREGDSGDGVYIVKDGLVEISGLIDTDIQRVFRQLGPGEIFGEMAVVEDRPRSATARTLKDTELYFMPRDGMLALLQRSPALAFGVLQEISHRLREFDQFHLREMMQAERLAVIGNFARSIIHDLKTPLTIIGLSAEMACMPNATIEKRAQSQERIRKQIGRINDMVGDILEFTRSQQPETPRENVNYPDFINEIMPDLRAEAETKSTRIELQNPPPSGKLILDTRRLRRVFFNLVHNATDAMPDGGMIFIRFLCDENEIITEIEDTGPGIAPEITGKLFDPFVTFGKAQGTGLGLSICKKIVEDHHGRIWTRTEPDLGAIFCFALPLAK
jgi:signal transduction histidine kinase